MNIHVGTWKETLSKVATGSVKFLFIDPPYSVLTGHKIEETFSMEEIPDLVQEIDRVLMPDSFFAFFGQMPTILDWLLEVRKIFKFKEHITWIKRNITSPYLDLQRSHEEVMIYMKGKPDYNVTESRYEDLKTPALHVGAYELSTLKTTILDLQRRLHDRAYDNLYFQNLPTANGSAKSNDNYYEKKYKVKEGKINENDLFAPPDKEEFIRAVAKSSVIISNGSRNDDFHKNVFLSQKRENKKELRGGQPYNDSLFSNRYPNVESFRYRSKWQCNLTNTWYFAPEIWQCDSEELANTVWSYLPENQISFGKEGNNHKHPTVKSLLLVKRAIELCTFEGDLVVDCFLGSGTTAVACKELGREFVGGDIEKKYIDLTNLRLQSKVRTLNLF